MSQPLHPLHNWVPYKLHPGSAETQVKWLFAGENLFAEPFFDETILRCKKLPENSSFFSSTSTLSWLKTAAETVDFLPPDGLIFHVSRCGSTLLAQLLDLKPDTIVLAEVPLLDEILRLDGPKNHAPETNEELLSAAIKLLGKKRRPEQQHLFLKLDSWHLFYYELLRGLYPKVPFYFLYRNPAEVLKSHQKLRGIHMVPGLINSTLFNLPQTETGYTDLDLYSIKILEAYFNKFLSIGAKNDPYSYFLNYNSGAEHHVSCVAEKSGLNFTTQEWEKIEDRSRFHSKFPGQYYSEQQDLQTANTGLTAGAGLYTALDEKVRKQKDLQFG